MTILKTILIWILEWAYTKVVGLITRFINSRKAKAKDEATNEKVVDDLKNANSEAERDAASDNLRKHF